MNYRQKYESTVGKGYNSDRNMRGGIYGSTTIHDYAAAIDKTLAVTLSAFVAIPGDSKDTLRWRTESEQENLGFMLVRRINPQFMDSIARVADTARAPDSAQNNAVLALRKRAIAMADTGWRPILARVTICMSIAIYRTVILIRRDFVLCPPATMARPALCGTR